MGNKETKFDERLKAIEEKLELLVTKQEQKHFSREGFMRFYNRVKYDLNMNKNIIPLRIVLSNKFAKSLQNEVLYPDDTGIGEWFVTGELSPVPILFANLPCDYVVETRLIGDFNNADIL